MPFREGEFYSRQAIQDVLGRDIVSFLPQRNHELVCGCFNTRLNPSAPREVLVGDKPRVVRAARLLVEQRSAISRVPKTRQRKMGVRGRLSGNGILYRCNPATASWARDKQARRDDDRVP